MPPRMPRTAATSRACAPRGRWPGGPDGGRGWPRPGTGWRPRTRAAATRSGPGRWPGTPRQLTGVSGLPGGQRTSRVPTATTPSRGRTSPTRIVRVMRNQKGYVAGYNGQAVVTADQVIVGAMLSQHPVDRTLLHPLLDTCRQQLTEAGVRPKLRTVLAGSGYASEETFARADADGLRLLAPLAKDPGRRRTRTPQRALHLDRLPATARARRRLLHPRGKEDYKMRARTVEPVFGQLKTCQKLTMMSRRGLTACENEWLLACAAHNLRKLHRHRAAG